MPSATTSGAEPVGYENVRIGLRAPRVAIVIDGTDQWPYWVRLALHVATGVWGGAGFIVIPHTRGEVNPAVLRMAVAYDPDHVVLLQPTIGEYELAFPGRMPLQLDGRTLEAAERVEFLPKVSDHPIHLVGADEARRAIAQACSPHRRRHDGDDRWFEDLTILPTSRKAGRELTALSDLPPGETGPRLSAPPNWGGLLGVAVAARCGVVDAPAATDEPELDEADLTTALRWLLNPDAAWSGPPPQLVWQPTVTMSVDASRLDTAFTASTRGLTWVNNGLPVRDETVCVYGDTAADFALALGYDRLYGRSMWVPPPWAAHTGSVRDAVALMLQDRVEKARFDRATIRFVSTSVDDEALTTFVEQLRSPVIRFVGLNGTPDRNGPAYDETVKAAATIDFPRKARLHLAVTDQYDQQLAVPVRRDDDGGFHMAAPPPPPAIEHSGLQPSEALKWQVDLDFWPSQMPRGRGLDGAALLAPDEDPYLTWVRSGRDGISYSSHRYNLVLAGTPAVSRLARPRLRQLGLMAWVRAIASQQDMEVALSPAGRRVEILRRLAGSRERLAAIIAGPLLPALQAFQPAARRSSDAYPDGGGVVLTGGDGYQTLAGITCRMVDAAAGDVRAAVDELLSLRLVRRGVVLDCLDCEQVAFVSVDALGQANTCPRCGAVNELTARRWRVPNDEPRWFYDLHPALRELLRHDGDVPLLLSHYLRQKHRGYYDVAEVEATPRNGSAPSGEADLVGGDGEDVLVAEAKRAQALGNSPIEIRRAAAKRAALAAIFRADQLVLATTAPAWTQASVEAVCQALADKHWLAERPQLRLVTGLGGQEVSDVRVDVDTGDSEPW